MIIDSLSLNDRIIWMIHYNHQKGIFLAWDDFLKAFPNNNVSSLLKKLESLIDMNYVIRKEVEDRTIFKITDEGLKYYDTSIAKLRDLKKVKLINPTEKVILLIYDIQRTSILNENGLFTYNLTINYSNINSIMKSIQKIKIHAKNKDQMINKVWKKLNIGCPLFYQNIKTEEIIEGRVYPTFLAKMNVKLGSGTYLFKERKKRI